MNSQLAVIALVDVEAAINANSLAGNIYVVDNNRLIGSTGQGTAALTTTVVGCQIVNWLVSGIDWSNPLMYAFINNIKGEAVEKQIMIPQLFDSPAIGSMGYWWGGTVDAIIPGKYSYTLSIDLGGKMNLDWNLYLDVQTGFIMEATTATTARAKLSHSLQDQAIADGSIMNPNNFVSLFPRIR